MAEAVTDDTLLGGRVVLRQPAAGYRVAIDPVLLAAAVPAGDGDAVLECGSGVGAAALCLARRVAACNVVGLELAPDLAALARHNATANGLADRVRFMTGDVAAPPPALAPGTFDHVFANPPHLTAAAAAVPGHPGKAGANIEGAADLGAWLAAMLAFVRPQGRVTLIHRADRLADLLSGLAGHAGAVVVFPLWPGDRQAAKRVIVTARRGVSTPLRLAAGLVLHAAGGGGGGFTPAADAILRGGAALDVA